MLNLKYAIISILICKEICSKDATDTFNPCPDKFQYIHKNYCNYGIITIPGRMEGRTKIQVKITLAFHEQKETENNLNIGFLKSFIETKQDVMKGLGLKLKIPFPSVVYWPIVTDISVNNNTICSGQKVNMWKVTYRQSFTYPEGPAPTKYIPRSPCSNIFQYMSKNGENYGIISIPGPREGNTRLKVTFFIYETLDNNNVGSLSFLKSYHETLADAQTQNSIQYKLKFPKFNYWPIIKNITLNEVNICVGPKVTELASWTNPHKFNYPKLTNKFQNVPPNSPNSEKGENKHSKNLQGSFNLNNCGKRDFNQTLDETPVQMVIGGKLVEVGEYPWMVAMFESQRQKLVFFCSANLVTNQHIITAAHCVKNKIQVQLEFGVYHLEKINSNSGTVRLSKEIIIHPEYKTNQAHSDIAIVSFNPIAFSSLIQPICIWNFDTTFNLFTTKGHISGWGQADALEPSINIIPLQTTMNIASLDDCRKSHIQLQNLATDKTFCAGGRVAGPCRGDSGSGFYVNISNRWYLRGVISTSLGTQLSCYVDKYSVFVNIAQYLDWIKDVML